MSPARLSTDTPLEIVLSEVAFTRQVEAMLRRFDQMVAQAPVVAGPEWQARLREEFHCALEELRTNAEELRAQHLELKAAQETAERHDRRFYDLFNFAPDAYLVTDALGVVQEMNRAALELFQVT